jgi:hypothetical protein
MECGTISGSAALCTQLLDPQSTVLVHTAIPKRRVVATHANVTQARDQGECQLRAAAARSPDLWLNQHVRPCGSREYSAGVGARVHYRNLGATTGRGVSVRAMNSCLGSILGVVPTSRLRLSQSMTWSRQPQPLSHDSARQSNCTSLLPPQCWTRANTESCHDNHALRRAHDVCGRHGPIIPELAWVSGRTCAFSAAAADRSW